MDPYRYTLDREVAPLTGEGHVAWVMLNPSTATATQDDPTIRKCIGFTRRWGYATLEVVNIFAIRSTDPRALYQMTAEQAIGEGRRNDDAIRAAVRRATRLVFAWGIHGKVHDRARAVCRLVDAERRRVMRVPASAVALPVCLGRTNDGQPRHPLMVAYSVHVETYEAPA